MSSKTDWIVEFGLPILIGIAVVSILGIALASTVSESRTASRELASTTKEISRWARVRFIERPGISCAVLLKIDGTAVGISCVPAPPAPAEAP